MALRVDTHAHVFVQGLPLIPGTRYVPHADHTPEDYLAQLDENGIDCGVLVAFSALGTYADYTLEALRAHPKRLRGTCIVDPSVGSDTLRAMDAAGMVGIRFMLLGYAMPDLESPEYTALFRRLAELDWHIHIYADGAQLAHALPILSRSGLTVVVDHFGHPDPGLGTQSPGFQAALRALDSGRCFIKLSAAFRFPQVDAALLAGHLMAEAGTERLLWGSDWPFTRFEQQMSYATTAAQLKAWVPDEGHRQEIHRTAARLYRFEE